MEIIDYIETFDKIYKEMKTMKRILVLLLIAVMVFTVISTAYTDTEKEIVFNNLSWGISIVELNNRLEELGYRKDKANVASLYPWVYNNWADYVHQVKDTGFRRTTYYSFDDSAPMVAGYRVDCIEMDAYYDYDDSKVNFDESNSHFCSAFVVLDIEYELVDSAYEDLCKKLTRLYGDGVRKEVRDYYSFDYYEVDKNERAMEWYGANNTAVRLEEGVGKDWKRIYLHYGLTDIGDKLPKIRELVIKAMPSVDEDDLSGL